MAPLVPHTTAKVRENNSASLARRLSDGVIVVRQPVAHSPDGVNQRGRKLFVDFVAQVLYVDVNDIGDVVEVNIPDVLDDVGAGNCAARVPQQELQQGEFLGRKLNLAAAASDPALRSIECQIGDPVRGHAAVPTAQQRAQAAGQLREDERLGQVVVGPGIESGHHVLDGVPAGQYQQRQSRLPLSRSLQLL